MVFRQLFDPISSTYTYLIGVGRGQDAVLIDPVIETVDRDLTVIRELGVKLKFILETHVHADHVTGAWKIREKTGAEIAVSGAYGIEGPHRALNHGDRIKIGDAIEVQVIATPGHTVGCLSYFMGDRVFTGDALLYRGCGRTDFQGGSSTKLFHSVRDRLFTLPDETLVFPAHDYKGHTVSTIGEEKSFNPRLGLSLNETDFIKIMAELKLSPPAKIKEAVLRNLKLGA